jgi:hypothetical protein
VHASPRVGTSLCSKLGCVATKVTEAGDLVRSYSAALRVRSEVERISSYAVGGQHSPGLDRCSVGGSDTERKQATPDIKITGAGVPEVFEGHDLCGSHFKTRYVEDSYGRVDTLLQSVPFRDIMRASGPFMVHLREVAVVVDATHQQQAIGEGVTEAISRGPGSRATFLASDMSLRSSLASATMSRMPRATSTKAGSLEEVVALAGTKAGRSR